MLTDLVQLGESNPFLTSKVKRRSDASPCRVLFLYPNERGMSTIPPSIAVLSQILKDEGHVTSLFDTTFYKFDDEIAIEDSDLTKTKALEFRPVTESNVKESDLSDTNQQLQQVKPVGDIHDQDDEDLHFKKTTRSHHLHIMR